MSHVVDALSWFCLVTGGFFALVGGLGLQRFPEFFTRLHAASVTETSGAGLMVLGMLLQAGATLVGVKLVVLLAFLVLTGPVATHALAKAAMHSGLRPGALASPGQEDRS